MSVLPFPESMDSSFADHQVWDNAAFDNGGDSDDLTASKQSWGSLKSVFGNNPNASFDSVSGKENQGPTLENNQKSRIDRVLKKGVLEEKSVLNRDEKKIDEEIEQIETEIGRLNSRLEALRLEKTVRAAKMVEKRGRVVPAKFMEQKQSVKNVDEKKRIEESSSVSAKPKVLRRGLSLGPAEILAAGRRGMSLGPSEIFGSEKSKQCGRQEIVTPLQSRRKSCFLKLENIEEEKVVRGKCSSLSPKSRKLAGKNQVPSRQAVTTIASKKAVRKDDLIQPKKLFKDGEKSVQATTSKKPLRPGRVVASRYNQSMNNQASAMRKRSLPENETDEGKRCDKKRSLSIGKSSVDASESKVLGSEIRVKKRWEIPSEIVVHGSSAEDEKSLPDNEPVVIVPKFLPSIRIGKLVNESPRDSGAAKRVAELVGRKSFFAKDDEESVCQALSYDAEEENDVEEN